MKVHHLNCGTMQFPGAPLVCHVLLLETDGGLVLVDSGFGLDDIARPRARLGPMAHLLARRLRPEEAAMRQIEALGLEPNDVRHIIVTHFDADHIGGLSDFPQAEIHTTAAEVLAAVTHPDRRAKVRYRAPQWRHGPRLVEHTPQGESWLGFAAAKELGDIAPGIVLVSLPGHTRGHACIAVQDGARWLFHAGDAFYHPSAIGEGGTAPMSLRILERLVAVDYRRVLENHARLSELHRRPEPDVLVFSAHDPSLYARALAAADT